MGISGLHGHLERRMTDGRRLPWRDFAIFASGGMTPGSGKLYGGGLCKDKAKMVGV